MIKTIFASNIYKFKFNNHDQILKILNEYFSENTYTNGLQKFSITESEIIQHYGYVIEEVIGTLDNLNIIEGPWLVVYDKGDSMGSHSHRAFEYTMMHYISLDENHPQTIVEDILDNREYNPNCKEGDILIIPGYLNHKVNEITEDFSKKRVVGVINFNSKNFVPRNDIKVNAYVQSRSEYETGVKNILEDYVYPGDENLIPTPIPDGMCKPGDDCYSDRANSSNQRQVSKTRINN